MALVREELQDKHLRAIGNFQCREEGMELFLKNDAYDYSQNNEGNTYLIINEESGDILAYYTLKCNAIQIIKEKDYKVLPAIEIARLAVDIEYEGKGIASTILALILDTVLGLRKHVGIKYIYLFSVPSAIRFYKTSNKAELKFKEFPKGVEFLKDKNSQEGCQALFITLDDYNN